MERIADIPIPQVVEELVEVFKLQIVEIIAETVQVTYLLLQHIICRFGDIETGFQVVTMVKRLSKQEHFAALAQITSRWVNNQITHLTNKLQTKCSV